MMLQIGRILVRDIGTILVKEFSCFLSLSEQSETKLKSFGLMSLAEEISRQSSINCVMWLPVKTLVQIYNEKEEAGQNKCKMYSLRRKKKTVPGNVMLEPS